jgi:elongation factor 1 alpha-like protein
VAINKLDVAGWKEERYDEIIDKVKPFLIQIGFKESNVHFVPISGLKGLNLEKVSS